MSVWVRDSGLCVVNGGLAVSSEPAPCVCEPPPPDCCESQECCADPEHAGTIFDVTYAVDLRVIYTECCAPNFGFPPVVTWDHTVQLVASRQFIVNSDGSFSTNDGLIFSEVEADVPYGPWECSPDFPNPGGLRRYRLRCFASYDSMEQRWVFRFDVDDKEQGVSGGFGNLVEGSLTCGNRTGTFEETEFVSCPGAPGNQVAFAYASMDASLTFPQFIEQCPDVVAPYSRSSLLRSPTEPKAHRGCSGCGGEDELA
jgi:hypothetical protein